MVSLKSCRNVPSGEIVHAAGAYVGMYMYSRELFSCRLQWGYTWVSFLKKDLIQLCRNVVVLKE